GTRKHIIPYSCCCTIYTLPHLLHAFCGFLGRKIGFFKLNNITVLGFCSASCHKRNHSIFISSLTQCSCLSLKRLDGVKNRFLFGILTHDPIFHFFSIFILSLSLLI